MNDAYGRRVLVFSEEYTKTTKGMFVVWLNHAREMSKTREVDILLNAGHWAHDEARTALRPASSVSVRRLPFDLPGTRAVRALAGGGRSWGVRVTRFALRETLNLLSAPLVVVYLYLLIRQIKPDALFSHAGGWPNGILCRWIIYAAVLARVPWRILIIHNYPTKGPGLLWGLVAAPFRWLRARSVFMCATAIVTVSDSVRLFLESEVFKGPVTRIYNGIQVSSFTCTAPAEQLGWYPQGQVVGFVGALSALKGMRILLDAFRLVDAPCELALLGPADPEYLRDLRERARLCINKVSFLGFHNDVDSFMERIDFLVVPSTAFESFGMVILEAMRHSKAVICSDFGGMKEVVEDGVTGLVVPAGDASALANAMGRLLGDADARRRMGEAGYRRLRALFSAERMAEQYDSLIVEH
jgi:glycosyltransferase involved in cell wall biosynthesis